MINLNTKISFNINSKHTSSVVRTSLIIISFFTLIASIFFSFQAYRSNHQPVQDTGGGQLLNQGQVEKAFNLLQEKTVQFSL